MTTVVGLICDAAKAGEAALAKIQSTSGQDATSLASAKALEKALTLLAEALVYAQRRGL